MTTKAMVAINHATYGGIYYSSNVDFTTPGSDPTWTKYATTGLANLNILSMRNDPYNPYGANGIYVQLDNLDVYRWTGSAWTKIMDSATGDSLTGKSGGAVGWFTNDPLTPGLVWVPYQDSGAYPTRILKSVDYGANWTVLDTVGPWLCTGPPKMQAYGQYVIFTTGSIYPSIHFSIDGATSFTENQAWGLGGGGINLTLDIHHPNNVYAAYTSADYDLTLWTASTGTKVQAGLEFARNIQVVSEGAHWIDPINSGHQRIIKDVSDSDQRIYYTSDDWTTVNTPSALSGVDSATGLYHHALVAALENNAYIMFGKGGGSSAGAEPVHCLNGEGSTSAWQAAGANTNSAPYADSIPTLSACYVAHHGIYVGEAPADSGISVYSVEHNAFDTDHGPLKGDRGSWRNRRSDLDGSSVPYSDYHAEDEYRDQREMHTPIPTGNDGYGIIETGGYWTNSSDVLATIGDIHDEVTLDVDAAVILDLNGQEIGLDVQNANTVFAGPTTGAANEPTFRALVSADLPAIALNDMSDVDTAGAAIGDSLVYDGADWVPGNDLNSHEHVINEDHTDETDGATQAFATVFLFRSNTTQVYLNGLRQRIITQYTEDGTNDGITFITAPEDDDELIIDYIKSTAYDAYLTDSEGELLTDSEGEQLTDNS